jgi:hypothetical protein
MVSSVWSAHSIARLRANKAYLQPDAKAGKKMGP